MSFQLTRISATNLAPLNSRSFCPRCFWLKARLNFKLPFAMFPKIFNEFDAFQKSFTESYWREMGVLPPWLKDWDVEDVVPVEGYGKFFARHECGVEVSGVTDHVFRLKTKKHVVFDYKTSHPVGDSMFDIYKAQLSTYAWIAPRYGLGEISDLALVYYEPVTGSTEWRKYAYPEDRIPGTGMAPAIALPPIEGLCLNFSPTVVKVEMIDINPLVLRAKDLAEQKIAPKANGYCKECDRVEGWIRDIPLDANQSFLDVLEEA